MIHDTIQLLETRLREGGASLSTEQRAELMNLLHKLKAEIAELSKTHADQARSIAGFTDVLAHEATRTEKNERLLQLAVKGLSHSVEGFENSNPRLVQLSNTLANTLANMGI